MTGDLREKLLCATVRHVPFDGWSERALKAGAADIGVAAETAHILFPNGGVELIKLHSELADKEMERRLSEAGLGETRVRNRVSHALKTRLEIASDERELVRQALVLLALPRNAGLGARILYCTVDAIWRAAGDESSDWNFYTKRALLSGVYTTAVLYWLQDASPEFEDTKAFVDRRILDVMRLKK